MRKATPASFTAGIRLRQATWACTGPRLGSGPWVSVSSPNHPRLQTTPCKRTSQALEGLHAGHQPTNGAWAEAAFATLGLRRSQGRVHILVCDQSPVSASASLELHSKTGPYCAVHDTSFWDAGISPIFGGSVLGCIGIILLYGWGNRLFLYWYW